MKSNWSVLTNLPEWAIPPGNMQRLQIFVFTIILLALGSSPCAARDLAVVVNKANSTSNLTAANLTKMLNASTNQWPDSKRVIVLLADPASNDTKMLFDKVYSTGPKDVNDINSIAKEHKGDILIVGSDELVIKAVAVNPGAIG